MEKIINCKRLIGALERILYTEDVKRRIHVLAKELNYDEGQLETDLRALEESRLIYGLGENDDTTNQE